MIGRVAQTGVERMIGTVIGGLVGFGTYVAGRDVWNEVTDGVGAHAVASVTGPPATTACCLRQSSSLWNLRQHGCRAPQPLCILYIIYSPKVNTLIIRHP